VEKEAARAWNNGWGEVVDKAAGSGGKAIVLFHKPVPLIPRRMGPGSSIVDMVEIPIQVIRRTINKLSR
jgi:hypothetical protein